MENKNIPEIRFPGFSGDWEQRKLGDIAFFAKGHGYSKSDLTDGGKPVILYGRLYTKYETVIESVDTFTIEKEKSVISKGDEVIVPSSGESAEDISRASAVIKPGIILGGDLNIIRTRNEIEPVFLALTISNGKQQLELSKRAQGKSVVHLHISDLKEVNLLYPKKEEQTKVSNFLKQIDEIIALHLQELNTLKQTKQGFLQKMFPKEGESVPEVRFPGFTGDWEKRKLGSHADILTGGTPKTQIKEYWEPKEVPWMSSGEVNKKRLTSTGNMISTLGLENSSARWVKKNSVLIALAGQGKTRGTVAINEIPLTTNQSIAAIVPMGELHYEFIFHNLEKRYQELRLISSSDGTRGGLNKQLVSDVIIMSPSIEEQIKIGSFFKQLDETIVLHQRELEALKETKKAFLQKMFV